MSEKGIAVVDLAIETVLGNTYTFKKAFLIKKEKSIHVKGKGKDFGINLEASYDSIVTLLYKIDKRKIMKIEEETANEEETDDAV